ncbi:MAG TPA: hypothetical protein VJ225_02285 [Nitrososphaeraceae archaeon]|nr:hypothetical protein [Nitrososphaeraceae archaeon]
MKNVLPGFVIKTGKTPFELNDDDIVAISYITAKIAAKLQKIKKLITTPRNMLKRS